MSNVVDVDIQYWEAVRRNDYRAFEKLFHKYYASLCRYAEGFLGDSAQAEDVVQDMFTYFWEHRLQIELEKSVAACFYTAVRHRALRGLENYARQRSHDTRLLEYIEDLQNTDYSEDEERDIERIRQIIQQLPAQCLKVFVMSSLEGKKYAEIAKELSISINTVKTHITKAYRIIRQEIDSDKKISLFFIFSVKTITRFR